LVEEKGEPKENHWPVASHWHTIRLVQHAKKLRIMISNLQLAHQENVSDMQLARKKIKLMRIF
jgi:hypothetical protein